LRRPKAAEPVPERIRPTGPGRLSRDSTVIYDKSIASRQRRVTPENRRTLINNNIIVNNVTSTSLNRTHRYGGSIRSRVTYHDRPYSIGHTYNYDHIYRDYLNRTCHRTIWPRYRFVLGYNRGYHTAFRYCYPYYHRKYIFVSLSGYWPLSYSYVRYYWYGAHPYRWYGYYPVAREVRHDTYNYYTYNYYYSGEGQAVQYEPTAYANYITPVDHTTFADVRAKLALEAAGEPGLPTLADTYFEEAVKAFEIGQYAAAVVKFANAIELAPDDMILPFAYAQALFANGQYSEAAVVLRTALADVSPGEEEGVFYPRGLYSDEDKLFEHIDRLAEKAEFYTFDADLQLLLGYHLLGVGETDAAVGPLMRAGQDLINAPAANVLLKLLEKIKADNATEDAQLNTPDKATDQ